MNEQPAAETNRQYGELYYRADAVAALLRFVADLLEGPERSLVLRLSHDIPSTMSWADHSADVQLPTGFDTVCRRVQLRLLHDTVLGTHTIRLDALLRRGPSPEYPANRGHATGLADGASNAK